MKKMFFMLCAVAASMQTTQAISVAEYLHQHGQPAIINGSLGLSNCNLTSLEGLQNIQQQDEIRYLHLSNNQLQTLPAGIFNGLVNLQLLDLSHNRLQTLPAGIFNGLVNLQWLHLFHNQLQTLPAGIFNGLVDLLGLDLYGNPIVKTLGLTNPYDITRQKFIERHACFAEIAHCLLSSVSKGRSVTTNLFASKAEKEGFDINGVRDTSGNSLLHIAAMLTWGKMPDLKQQYDKVVKMITPGAAAEARSSGISLQEVIKKDQCIVALIGELTQKASERRLRILKMLLAFGADLNTTNASGQSVMQFAMQSNAWGAVEDLMEIARELQPLAQQPLSNAN